MKEKAIAESGNESNSSAWREWRGEAESKVIGGNLVASF